MSGRRTVPAPASLQTNISASSARRGTPSRFRRSWPALHAPPPAARTRSSRCSPTPIPECLPTISPSAVTIAIFPPLNFALRRICSPPPARLCATVPPTPSAFLQADSFVRAPSSRLGRSPQAVPRRRIVFASGPNRADCVPSRSTEEKLDGIASHSGPASLKML